MRKRFCLIKYNYIFYSKVEKDGKLNMHTERANKLVKK